MTRETLGDFEQLVLLACLRLGGEAYTVAVLDEIAARTGRSVSHSAVYVALRRLESRGLVESRVGESRPERGGRARRYFGVCPEAVPELVRARDQLRAMWDGVDQATLDRVAEG